VNDTRPFTFLAQTPPRRDSEELLYANGIFADSGLPLCQLNISTAAQLAQGRPDSRHEQLVAQHKYDQATQPHYGTIGDVDPAKLEESGWGIVFSVNTEAKIKEALQPLLKLREQQAGRLFRVFENADSYRPGESCSEWLARHKVSLMPVDPEKGVPYYLLLVGAPEEIPFEFQYLLDVYWAVGRLHFDDSADYRRYAESVVAYEQATALPHTRRAAIFATSHEFDQATELFAKQVAVPLTKGDGARKPLGEKQNFRLQSFIGDSATKETLTQLLQGKIANGPPALLFTGSHGMGFHLNDPRLPEAQGALVCQDWAGWGKISENDWFAARDVPADAQVHGLIHFFFACYGAGCPQIDDFFSRPGQQPEQISPRALIAKLPQKLLAHPNGGALAALGHVDRAWSYSFYSEKAGAQLQGFQDVMGRLLRGDRLGQATDQFDVRRAALASQLTDVLQERGYGNKKISDQDIVNLWIARNDARNYIILGDPAVRLRVESLTDQWTARRVTSIAQPAIEPAAATSTMAPSLATENSLPQNNIETQLRRTKIMNETPSSAGGLPYDLFRAPGSADKELVDAWKAHVKNAYQRNELMFAQVLKGFMKPYWTTVWINGILVAVGVASFIVAAYMGYAKELEFSIIFGGLSTLTFLGYFISRPLRALEQNLMFITWLGLIYNTYWMRLANCLNEPTAREDLANLQKDASQDIERLIAKHTEVAAKLPDLKEKEKGEEKDKKDKKDEEKKADEKAAASTSTTDGRQQQQQQQNQLVDEKLTADEEIAC
jgi:hypothetical protein